MTRGGASAGGLIFACLDCSSCIDRAESRMYAGVANTSTAATAIKIVTRMLCLRTSSPVEIALRSEFDSTLPTFRKVDANGVAEQFILAAKSPGSDRGTSYGRDQLSNRMLPLAESEPSRMVSSCPAARFLKLSVVPSGQRTSISAIFSAPNPKCSCGSHET